jgi:uncharacterized membrane protein YhaH (DUF805 family)
VTFAQKLFSFQGRIRRRDFWLTTLVLVIVMLCLRGGLALSLGLHLKDPMLNWIVLVSAWPSTAVMVKRFHDRDQSGWWCATLWASTLYDYGEPFFALPTIPHVALKLTMFVVGMAGLVVIGFLDGAPGPNRFGDSPKHVQGDVGGLPDELART